MKKIRLLHKRHTIKCKTAFRWQTIGTFSQFFEHSDVLGAVSECVSTSLADKTSIGGAEKQENDRVCFGITVAVFGKAMFV